jgi:hypothetical protein
MADGQQSAAAITSAGIQDTAEASESGKVDARA